MSDSDLKGLQDYRIADTPLPRLPLSTRIKRVRYKVRGQGKPRFAGLQDEASLVAETAVIVHVVPRWISVEEALPEPGQLCLVAALDDYDLACYVTLDDNQFWHGWRFSYPLDVTHWQPLPGRPGVNDET